MKFEILHRWNASVLFAAEIDCAEDAPRSVKLGLAVKVALSSKANLSKADLSKADLSWANLSKANLSEADLSKANLSKANLSEADLSKANLSKADLSKADLSKANLSKANLSEADLSKANLSAIKKDFFERLTLAKNEVKGLYDYLMRGKVDGSSYEGECACFVGTVAKVAKEDYESLTCGLEPDASSPTERWFFGISKGTTPDNNQVSAITGEWIREFAGVHEITLPDYRLVSSEEFPAAFEGGGE